MFMGALIGFAVGLVIGWNFLPQPEFIAKWFSKE